MPIATPTTYVTNENCQIVIPTPIIKVNPATSDSLGQQTFLTASYLPFSRATTEDFKAYNPKFYLFREKSRSKTKKYDILGNSYGKAVPKGFYHPTHLNGINFPANTPVYGGSTRIPFDTEYDLGGITPYNYVTLPFNPFQWVEFNGGLGVGWIPMTNSDWQVQALGGYRFTGKKNINSRSILFKIAIGINNPNGSTTNPILFGDFSSTFRLQFLSVNISRQPANIIYAPSKFTIVLQDSTVSRKIARI